MILDRTDPKIMNAIDSKALTGPRGDEARGFF